MKYATLKNLLENFKGAEGNEENLSEEFKTIARKVFYGGYFLINNKKKIYITDIEFYYHEEGNEPGKIKDPCMYHTCDRKKEPELTYLEPFSIHPHISGIDVAFENKEKKFRASFLIRGFQCEKDIKPEKRSTYIYEELLMNFSLEEGVSIKWHDKMCNEGEVSTNEVRKNISAYLKTTDGSEAGAYKKDEKGNYIKQYIDQANRKGFVQCERKWRYTKQL